MGFIPRKISMPVTISGIRSSNTLQVSIGGTGNNTLTSGSLLVGNGNGPIATIAAGAEGQILGVVNGEWTAIDNSGGGGGGGGLSSITTSGNLQGSGTTGSPATLKANISLTSVTASFKGDGSQITGLTATQVSDFDSSVDARITNIPNAALQNNYITINGQVVSLGDSVAISSSAGISSVYSTGNVEGDGTSGNPLNLIDNVNLNSLTTAGDITVNGNLYVNGAQTIVNTTDLAITDNVILIASGASNAAQLDGAGIHFGRLPSEDARIIYDSANDWMEIYPGISSSVIRGAFIGDGSGLTGVGGADPSVKTFTATGITVGQAVALSGSLVVADKSNRIKSNVIGVATAVSGTSVTVKMFGEVTTNGASSFAVGSEMYLGSNGSVVAYASIGSGNYATQVGFISEDGKIILQPRVFGQLA